MTFMGMTAGLIAGVLAALSTYTVQSVTKVNPIFRVMPATTLRSGVWIRSPEAATYLGNPQTGRARILLIQLQGHLFFANSVGMSEDIQAILRKSKDNFMPPRVVILDFTLVVGLDSSAAQTVVKLKTAMQKSLDVETVIFVTGSHRETFPCKYKLTKALSQSDHGKLANEETGLLADQETGLSRISRKFAGNRVFRGLDEALIYAEDFLIASTNIELWVREEMIPRGQNANEQEYDESLSMDEERRLATQYMMNLAPTDEPFNVQDQIQIIMMKCVREEYHQAGTVIWKQGDESTSIKLLLVGTLVSHVEEGGGNASENIVPGSILGELGLLHGYPRFTTVQTASTKTVLYSLSREAWRDIAEHHPNAARVLDRITIRYLAHRVQHVSNRIFETRCLPI